MGYYTEVYGELECKNIKKAIEIIEEIGYLDEYDYEIEEEKQECICEKCGNKHFAKLNKGIIKFNFERKFVYEDFKEFAKICEGTLICRGEDIEDLSKLKFENGKMKIIKYRWEE